MPKFRLEPLLHYSQSLQQQAQIDLSKALQQSLACQQEIASYQAKLSSSQQTVIGLWRQKPVNIQMIRLQNQHQENIKRHIQEHQTKLMDFNKVVDQKRKLLLQATTKLKTIVHLKDKFLKQLALRQKKLEDNITNEISINRFIYERSKTVD